MPYTLRFVRDLSVTQQQVKIWHDDSYYCDDDKLIKWYEILEKTQVSKSTNQRRTSAHCLKFLSCDALVHARRRKKKNRQKNCGHKYRIFLLVFQTHFFFFDQNEIKKGLSVQHSVAQ